MNKHYTEKITLEKILKISIPEFYLNEMVRKPNSNLKLQKDQKQLN